MMLEEIGGHSQASGTAGNPSGIRPEEVAGVVLAGGRSTRMGRDKAWMDVGGELLLARQTRVLREVGIGRIYLSLRRDMIWAEPGAVVVRDKVDGLGPLAGIAAAMAHAPDRHWLVLAVDMPRVNAHHVRALLEEATEDIGVVPAVETRWEPLCALYPPRALDLLERHLAGSHRSASAWVDALAAAGRIREASGRLDGEVLRSWNRPDDVRDAPLASAMRLRT